MPPRLAGLAARRPAPRRSGFIADRRGLSRLEWAFAFVLLAAGLVALNQTDGRFAEDHLGGVLARILPATISPGFMRAPPATGCQAFGASGAGCPVRLVQDLTGIPRGDGRTVAFIVAAPRRD